MNSSYFRNAKNSIVHDITSNAEPFIYDHDFQDLPHIENSMPLNSSASTRAQFFQKKGKGLKKNLISLATSLEKYLHWMPESGLNEESLESFRAVGELLSAAGEKLMEAQKKSGNINLTMPKNMYLKKISLESKSKIRKRRPLPLLDGTQRCGGRPKSELTNLHTTQVKIAQQRRNIRNANILRDGEKKIPLYRSKLNTLKATALMTKSLINEKQFLAEKKQRNKNSSIPSRKKKKKVVQNSKRKPRISAKKKKPSGKKNKKRRIPTTVQKRKRRRLS